MDPREEVRSYITAGIREILVQQVERVIEESIWENDRRLSVQSKVERLGITKYEYRCLRDVDDMGVPRSLTNERLERLLVDLGWDISVTCSRTREEDGLGVVRYVFGEAE